MKIRRFMPALLLVLVLLLQACGGTATPTSTVVAPADTATSAPAATDEPTTAAATTAPTMEATATTAMSDLTPETGGDLSGTVTFWSSYNTVSPEMETLTGQIIPAFQKQYPNVTVKAQALPGDELRQKLLTSIAGGETPDVVRADIIWVPEFAELGALAKLDEEMEDFDDLKEQVYPGPLSTNFYKGNYYGLPLDTNTKVAFYNNEVLAAAGMSAPPKDWAEFTTFCEKVKALNKPDTYCYAESGTGPWSILPWIWAGGGSVTDPEYTKATGYVNSPKTVAALTTLRDLLKNGLISPSILGGGMATSDALGKGQAGMIIEGPWMPPIFEKQFPELKYTLATLPAGAGGTSSVVGGEDIVLFEKSQNKEASVAFIRFMLSEEAQLAMGKVGQMPVLKSLSGNSAMPAYYATFQEQLQTAQARTPSPAWPKIDEALNTAFQEVFRGEKEPQAALDEAATVIDGLLAGKP
ncbi:MAG TPA: extracellular solute-binding protein [Chloroflexia bacterium]|jgi:multiple sugar transport system substrate-binding protein